MDPTQILTQILAAAGLSAGQIPSNIDFSPGNILRSILILIVVYIAARIVRSLLQRAFRRAHFDKRLEQLVLQVVYYGIIGLGVIWILGGFGLSVVLLSILFGFAFKDLIQNFAAGLLIMGTRPFQLDDWIVVQGNEGRVAEVGWRGTLLDTFDGKRVIIPNSMIITSVVTNNSLKTKLRSSINLAVDLQSDFARVEQLILGALKPIEYIASEPAPTVWIESITGKAMNLVVQIWISEPVNRQKRVISQALRAIKDVLEANDIDLNPATTVSIARTETTK